MSVIPKLASSLGRRDETPNVDLAKQVAAKKDKTAIKELADNLLNKNKNIANDCIKTLYEIGSINPALISDYTKEFISIMDTKDNRMQWGAMTALSSIVKEKPNELFKALPKILSVADKGSVITKDHCYNILLGLCTEKKLSDSIFPLMFEQLLKSPPNQFPKYVEDTLPLLPSKYAAQFSKIISSRLKDVEKESKRNRLLKVLKKLGK